MRIKLATLLVVIAATIISTELTAWGQKSTTNLPPNTPEERLIRTFSGIVGRAPTPKELFYWKDKERGNEVKAKALDVKIAVQIMDWFVAPEQAGERSAMIDNAYKEYFNRPANMDEKTSVGKLVRLNRIPASGMFGTIGIDFTITHIADVAGDPHALKVTVVNLSPVSTSSKTYLAVRFWEGEADCLFASGTPAAEKFLDVPPLAPQQSVVVKVTSAKLLQQSNSQRSTYQIDVGGGDNGYIAEPNTDNNTKCVPRVMMKITKDKPIPKLNNQFPKDQRPSANPPPILRKP